MSLKPKLFAAAEEIEPNWACIKDLCWAYCPLHACFNPICYYSGPPYC
jgi:hypothetical protein